ncbi:MAG: hypothetical protein AMS27_13155 [Bacteroides sp. SM23_62_1]|nr:MAG: hypothetical protein AMS27_13155 [Bacteroides sp. SM23_62_1]
MQENNNDHIREFVELWNASDDAISSKYNLKPEEMETYIMKESIDFLKKLRINTILDLILKGIMCIGLTGVWIIYPSNYLVAGSTAFLVLCSLVLGYTLWKIIQENQKLDGLNSSTMDITKQSIELYSRQSVIFPFSWAVSMAMFYILGSFLYHHFVYDEVAPFDDLQDFIILSLFLLAGIVFAYISNHYVTVKRLRSLQNLFLDLDSPQDFLKNREKWMNAQRIRRLVGIFLAVLGLAALVTILILLR